ncbi:hypothetical protein HanRHA438_Chr06g0270721 [Helianthus annuus]|nr:hypothetical protein HanIR_Chr06g0281151 [Helianthus annuus]KAJ0912122.1 hypothetical protein HanRHA438_Chr06g0270721 [Helianthus annuus]
MSEITGHIYSLLERNHIIKVVYVGAEPGHCLRNQTLSKLNQKAIKEKELKRKSCVTSCALIPPLYVKMNVLN